MSAPADTPPRGAGAAADTPPPEAAQGACNLLAAVEPPSEGSGWVGDQHEPPSDGYGPRSAALLIEATRLSRELGADLQLASWRPGVEADVEPLAEALAELVTRRRPAALLLADTDLGRRLTPLVAHRLGSGIVVGCSDVLVQRQSGATGRDGPRTLAFVKPVYGGWLEREIVPAPGVVPVVTLDLDGTEAPDGVPEGLPTPEILDVDPPVTPRTRRVALVPPDPRFVDLVHADRIVAAGAGSLSEDLLMAVQELADLLGGSVGATRPVVDDGGLAKERLIGQTGRTVTPELYLALGISGSPHHVAGVRGRGRILSINRDVRAPIFQFSDIGYVADLETVLPALVQRIKEWRDACGSPDERH